MKANYPRYLLSACAGATLPFAFAPFYYWPLAILAPMILLVGLSKNSSYKNLVFIQRKSAFLLGYIFGLAYFSVGASWIYISIHTFGDTPAIIAAIITLLFIMILASYFGLQCLFTTYFSARQLLFTFPAFGALCEWVRGWFLSGFPWLQLGQSQTLGPFKGYLPLVGVYGTTFLLLLCSSLLFFLFSHLKHRRITFYYALVALITLFLIAAFLNTLHWTKTTPKKISVALIQGNIPQEIKWSPEQLAPTLDTYISMTVPFLGRDIIFWPEGAVPLPLPYAKKFVDHVSHIAKQHHSTIVFGVPVENKFNYYNAIVSTDTPTSIYYKRHLVPFGEYVPLANLLRGLIGFFDLPMSNFIAGNKDQTLLTANHIGFGSFVCYEIAYTQLLHHTLKQNPAFLVTLSNDAWFGESWAPYQHAQIAQVAAILSGRYLVLNANSGLTAIYDTKGQLIDALPLFVRDSLEGTIYTANGQTPWSRLGDAPIIALLALLLIGMRLNNFSLFRIH